MSRILLPLLVTGLLSDVCRAQEPDSERGRVALHAGVAYARLPDPAFEIVSSVGGQDLFARVGAQEERVDAVALLSHSVRRDAAGPADLWLTLGSSVKDPGSVIYLGASVGLSAAMLTAGASTALVDEGLGETSDQVYPGTGVRTLYARLDRVREWGVFVSLTFNLLR